MTTYTKDSLEEVNSLYSSIAVNWLFLYHSYRGGHLYKEQDYLARYVFETSNEYRKRAEQTPLDNHCQSVVQIYTSFIFANEPVRELGTMAKDPVIGKFLEDADREGRNFTNFMKEASTLSSVLGHSWIIVDRPSIELTTRQEEIEQDVRPYVSVMNPLNVIDWEYTVTDNGSRVLTHLKVKISENVYKCYYQDYTDTITIIENGEEEEVHVDRTDNPYGKVMAVCVYNKRDAIPGIGISDIADIADMQRAIFNENSEIEQIIRLSSHPSLVKTAETQAGAGAGAIIQIPDDITPETKPYLLQPNAQSLDSIRASIKDKVESINSMANIGSIRTSEVARMSGVAMETEFRLLNARLAEKADQLELAEEQVLQLIAEMLGYQWDGVIKYPDSFNAHDTQNDLLLIEKAQQLTSNPKILSKLEKKLAMLMIDAEELDAILEDIDEFI
jgi:hypothetical protein